MMRSAALAAVGVLLLAGAFLLARQVDRPLAADAVGAIGDHAAAGTQAIQEDVPSAPATPVPATPVAETVTGLAGLEAQVEQLLEGASATGAVSLIELDGPNPQAWDVDGDQRFVAASTYKQPVLMEDAQNIAAGRANPNDSLCYQSTDWEDGYFSDYTDGRCYRRSELERRVGLYSDNTAAHILVRYDGGTAALNAYARAHGASESAFYYPNTTTSNDLARLWANEAAGQAGGAAAQQYLYPLLTHTAYERGVPAGVPAGTTVVHKVGFINGYLHDSALVTSGPNGPYVLSVLTNGSTSGWTVLANISQAVWSYESSR